MKLRLLTVLAIAGLAMAGCGSDRNDDDAADSATVDTTMNNSSTTDTSMTDTNTVDTTMNKPVDSTRQ